MKTFATLYGIFPTNASFLYSALWTFYHSLPFLFEEFPHLFSFPFIQLNFLFSSFFFYSILLHFIFSDLNFLSLCIKYCCSKKLFPSSPQPLFLLSKVYQIQEEVVLESLVGVIIQAAFNKFLCKHQIGEIHLVF